MGGDYLKTIPNTQYKIQRKQIQARGWQNLQKIHHDEFCS